MRHIRTSILFCAGLVALLSLPQLAAEATDGASHERMVRQLLLTWSDHGVSRLDALFAPQTGPTGGIPASGKSFSVRGVSVVTFDQGRIVRHSDYYDLASLVVQFGVRFAAPPPPAPCAGECADTACVCTPCDCEKAPLPG